MLSIIVNVLKRCMKHSCFFTVISSLLSRSKNDQKCIVYPSHVDILLQYHDIISSRRVLWGERLRDACGVELIKFIKIFIKVIRESRANVSSLIPLGERASKTRAFSLMHPGMHSKLKPQTEMAISLIGKNFNVGGFPKIS